MWTAKNLQKAKDKAVVAQKKATAKAAKELIKATKAENVEASLEEASLELLAFVQMIKDDHNELSKQPGFVLFLKFFLVDHDCKQ